MPRSGEPYKIDSFLVQMIRNTEIPDKVVAFIRAQFSNKKFIPLHEPAFGENEKLFVADAIESTFVSSVGEYVNKFEVQIAEATGAKYAVATFSGTSALHLALLLAGVKPGEEVITQAVSFVATANAIAYTGSIPIFVDIDRETLGLSPVSLLNFLQTHCARNISGTLNKTTGNRIAACVPMHTFGFPCHIEKIVEICNQWQIPVVEDSAESLGSTINNKHTGTFGLLGAFSLNGNKIITSGGGGAIVTENEDLAAKAKHLSTQAKTAHRWDFFHDQIGYNYRLPNLNAALACAQLVRLPQLLKSKRALAEVYRTFFNSINIQTQVERPGARANYWLNAIFLNNRSERDTWLEQTNKNNVMTRPLWTLLNRLPMYQNCKHDGLQNSQ